MGHGGHYQYDQVFVQLNIVLKSQKAAQALKNFVPLMDRVLVQKAEAVAKTKGGILIPEKAQSKVGFTQLLAYVTAGGVQNTDHLLIPYYLAQLVHTNYK